MIVIDQKRSLYLPQCYYTEVPTYLIWRTNLLSNRSCTCPGSWSRILLFLIY